MKKKNYFLSVFLLTFFAGQMLGQSYPTATIGYTLTPITIDGSIDDWNGIVTHQNTNRVIDTSAVTDTDVSWAVAWDSTNLYVMANVTDDVVIESSNEPGKGGDRVKISVGTENSRDGIGWGATWPHAKTGSEFWYTEDGSAWSGGSLGTWVEGVEYIMQTTDKGYVFEAKLPLSAYFEYDDETGDTIAFTAETGDKILFELGICDYDGGGADEYVELNWGTSLNTWGDMSDAGALVFTHILPSAPINYVETPKTIDGNNDDWSGMLTQQNLNRVIDTSAVADTDVFWSVAWDSTYLYIMADVTDDVVMESPNVEGKLGDRVKISVGTENSRDGIGWGATWPHSKTGSEFWYTEDGSAWSGGSLGTWVEGVEYVMQTTDGGYIFEAQLPLAAYFEYDDVTGDTVAYAPKTGNSILFELGICDFDGGGAGEYVELNWGLSQNTWASMDYTGTLRFIHAAMDYTAFLAEIESAKAAVAAAVIGEAGGQYLPSVVDAANAAIAAAEAYLAGMDSQEEINGGSTDLAIAMALFVANEITESVENNLHVDFVMYPNPAGDLLTIENISNANTISIYSVTGKRILSVVNSNNTIRMDVSNLAAGVYIVVLDTDNGTNVKRLLKK